MRLSLLFSVLVGVAALLTISQRLPSTGPRAELTTNAASGAPYDNARSVQADSPHGKTPLSAPAVRGRLYRWRDDGGAIHFQTDPPPADVRADVIPFVRQPPPVAAQLEAPSAALSAPDSADSIPALLSVYTPKGFEDLIRRVEETALKLRHRNQYVEALEKQL